MKLCGACKIEFPLEMFGKHSRNPDGLQYCCRRCKSESDRISRLKNLDNIKQHKKEYYLENKNHIIEKVNQYISVNRNKHNQWTTQSKLNLKTKVFNHYCNNEIKCENCEQLELELLTIDHIHGNGNQHRKEVGINTGYSTYSWLKKNNYPEGFQVLCWNCQYRKRAEEVANKNPTPKQIKQKIYNQQLKLECLNNYGKICSCGETDSIVLTLDHVNDDGFSHRKETNCRGLNFYLHLRKNNFPQNPPLQVLCLTCQYRKRILNEQNKNLQKQIA